MRLVFDTSIMVAAVRSDLGASRRLLVAALEGRLALLASTPLLMEYEAVMTRPEHLSVSGLTRNEVGQLLDAVAAVATPVRLAFTWRPMLRDADDEMVLETAVNGRAQAIVTFNQRDFWPVIDQFGVAVWSSGEALRQLEAI